MRQPSTIIHKGQGEEKYELYVEDYVISFLKGKTGGSDLSNLSFYGNREGRKYIIYGAGQDRNLAVFDKYEQLREISCRLTRTGPLFLIEEAGGIYEIKGYKIFYYANEEMQDYLIDQTREEKMYPSSGNTYSMEGGIGEHHLRYRDFSAGKETRAHGMRYHYAISLQVGLVFVVLVAIVINSANSYDKMEQLNQSAEEVFFVMENQETAGTAEADETGSVKKQNDIMIERDSAPGDIGDNGLQDGLSEDTILQDNVLYENTLQGNVPAETTEDGAEATVADDADVPEAAGDGEDISAETDTVFQANDGAKEEGINGEQAAEEGIEALSRNVARYYEVERGDTLYLISQKIYGDTAHVKKICELNQIKDPDNIRYGQKIILP